MSFGNGKLGENKMKSWLTARVRKRSTWLWVLSFAGLLGYHINNPDAVMGFVDIFIAVASGGLVAKEDKKS